MIDVHTHLHPPRLFAAIRRWFAERSDWNLTHPTEPIEVARTLRDAGVERFVFCSYAHKPGIARDLNAWLCATSRALDRFGLPLATVHLDDPDPLGDLRDALDDGAIGIKIHEDVQALPVDDPRWGRLFALLAEREAFVLAHIGGIPWNGETRSGPQRVAAVLERHPALRFVVAHFGLPDCERYVELMPDHPGLHLDTTMAFAKSSPMWRPIARETVERGARRVLYGTDYPNVPYAYPSEGDALRALGLTPPLLAAIMGDNARALIPALAER